jgi:SAM-dependent methyltransferase
MLNAISDIAEKIGDKFITLALFLRKREAGRTAASLPPMLFAAEAVQKLIDDFEFETLLDVGCGAGHQANAFLNAGKKVTAIDYGESVYFKENAERLNTIIADINTYEFGEQFDCVWCSHVLEHQLNPHAFLRRMHGLVKEGGILCVTVPPMKHEIVGGHVALWNAGLLLYHLVLAGFDCSEAKVKSYGYNISVIVRKRSIDVLSKIDYDSGDIRKIREYLPVGLPFGRSAHDDPFDGRIRSLNW